MASILIPGHSRTHYLNRMDKVVQYIQQNLAAPINLESVAREAGFSIYHFHRIFSALMGENPQDFINRLRLEHAANMLVKSPSLSITEVALTCGFTSSSAFARSFRKYFGQTAREYARQFNRADRPLAWIQARNELQKKHDLILPEIQVRSMKALHLAYFPARRGYEPASIQAAWIKMFQRSKEQGWLKPETLLVSISFDDPKITIPAKCRYYACMTVPAGITTDEQVGFFDLPEHLGAVCRVRCRQETIESIYHLLYGDWLPDSGYIMADLPPYEICLSEPEPGPNGICEFDLCIPVILI